MDSIQRGMILRVSRGFYDHYGVYVGNDQIVHFTSPSSDKSAGNSIMRTNMRLFIRDADQFDVMGFGEKKQNWLGAGIVFLTKAGLSIVVPSLLITSVAYGFFTKDLYNWFATNDYHLCSREECASRAERCLGFAEYNMMLDNCEHFALWCKVGIHTSTQVNKLIDLNIEKSRTIKANDYVPL
ncbi:lecithin retinol acyltransferase family protein [Aeromonas caviae]|uniref:lecithin retinol acyltransferase family protein n=1 Tax=Aeromonas caviae TaxID=648 RepID=UPI002B48C335|nr:lecithin retinol acyltransferase family protein [Aeromonas caviae]